MGSSLKGSTKTSGRAGVVGVAGGRFVGPAFSTGAAAGSGMVEGGVGGVLGSKGARTKAGSWLGLLVSWGIGLVGSLVGSFGLWSPIAPDTPGKLFRTGRCGWVGM